MGQTKFTLATRIVQLSSSYADRKVIWNWATWLTVLWIKAILIRRFATSLRYAASTEALYVDQFIQSVHCYLMYVSPGLVHAGTGHSKVFPGKRTFTYLDSLAFGSFVRFLIRNDIITFPFLA